MNEEAENLLMMFICDAYSKTGKVSKKTAIETMRFVCKHNNLSCAVNSGDNKAILAFRITAPDNSGNE